MKHVIPAAVALTLAASGLAYAQTPSSSSNTGATTTTNSVGTGTSATNGSSAGTTNNSARNSANTAGGPTGSPNTADTAGGHGANALGTAPVGNPNVNTSIGNTTNSSTNARGTSNNGDNSNNAVNTRPQNNPGAPHPGANSFTEGQARSRIQDKGFSQVTDLKKDGQGVWRGHATKDGKQVSVALDFQGNVVAQ